MLKAYTFGEIWSWCISPKKVKAIFARYKSNKEFKYALHDSTVGKNPYSFIWQKVSVAFLNFFIWAKAFKKESKTLGEELHKWYEYNNAPHSLKGKSIVFESRILLKIDSTHLNFQFFVRIWRIMEWVSRLWELGLQLLNQLRNSSESTWSFWIFNRICFTLKAVKPNDNESSCSHSKWIRWLWETFTKSRSWSFSLGIFLWGISNEH